MSKVPDAASGKGFSRCGKAASLTPAALRYARVPVLRGMTFLTIDPAQPPFGAFRIVSESLRLLVGRIGTLFSYAFGPALLITGLSRWTNDAMTGSAAYDPAASPLAVFTPGLLLIFLASLVLGVAAGGFMVLVVLDTLLGTRHSVGQYLSQTLRQILPLTVLTTLYGIAMGLAAVFLLVPGLYVMARYYPLVPAILFEDAGWSGLGRARDLTRETRWPIVGLILIVAVIVAALALGLGFAFSAISPIGGGVAFLAETILTTLYIAYSAVLTALVYLRLRERNEGMSRADVAATID